MLVLRPKKQIKHVKAKGGSKEDIVSFPSLPVSGITHPRPRQADRAACAFGGQIDGRAFFADRGAHPGFGDVQLNAGEKFDTFAKAETGEHY